MARRKAGPGDPLPPPVPAPEEAPQTVEQPRGRNREQHRHTLVLEDEAAVVGACLNDPLVRRRAVALLRPADLDDERHRALFEAAMEMDRRGLAYGEDTVRSLVGGGHERFGGFEYLRQLQRDYPTLTNLDHHVNRILVTRLKLDALVEATKEIAAWCEDPADMDPAALVGICKRWGARAGRTSRSRSSDAPAVMAATLAVLDSAQKGNQRWPGFFDPGGVLDRQLALGLRPGKVSVIGGRPARGKSLLAVEATRWRALEGHGTTVVSTESREEDIGLAMASSHLQIPYLDIVQGRASADDYERAREFCKLLSAKGLFEVVANPFDQDFRSSKSDKDGKRRYRSQGDLNEAALRELDRIVASSPHQLVIVDLFAAAVPETQVELFDRSLMATKQIAADHHKHVMLVHHLKRPHVEQRGDRTEPRPSVEELRGTGGWEQHMDFILLVDRPTLRLKGRAARGDSDTFDVYLEKQKDAPPSRVTFDFDGPCRALRNGRVPEAARSGGKGEEEEQRDPLRV